jgi:hypothetical protein
MAPAATALQNCMTLFYHHACLSTSDRRSNSQSYQTLFANVENCLRSRGWPGCSNLPFQPGGEVFFHKPGREAITLSPDGIIPDVDSGLIVKHHRLHGIIFMDGPNLEPSAWIPS